MNKTVFNAALLSSSLLLSGVAYAQSAYVSPLNSGLGNGAAVSCGACHSGTPSKGTAVFPMANTWRTGANLALSDSDGDGFNNAQEVSGGSTNFNFNATSPFTLAKATESSTSTKVVVVGAGVATETAITNASAQAGITLAAGHVIAGAVSPLITTPSATIFFNKAVNAGDKAYAVNFTTKTNTLLTSGVTFNANGSVTVSGLTAPVNLVVDRATPATPAKGAARGGGEDGEGCISGSLSMPILMWLSLFLMGAWIRRKAD
ncbi:MAG: hypothetical protein Q9N02_00420 [Ghiorsea sp.]|nr:hypothetical protein [Ghiorsea sp.]